MTPNYKSSVLFGNYLIDPLRYAAARDDTSRSNIARLSSSCVKPAFYFKLNNFFRKFAWYFMLSRKKNALQHTNRYYVALHRSFQLPSLIILKHR